MYIMHADIRRVICNGECIVYEFNISVTHGSENSKINSITIGIQKWKKSETTSSSVYYI